MGNCGEVWGKCGESVGNCGELWGKCGESMGNCGEVWGNVRKVLEYDTPTPDMLCGIEMRGLGVK